VRPPLPEPARTARRGVALPLALFVLLLLALLVALVLDSAVQDLRIARADVGVARAEAAVESALADLLAAPVDSAFLVLPRGAARQSVATVGGDTARVAVQPLGGGLARVVAMVRSSAAGVRADAGAVVLLRAERDTTAHLGGLRFRRLPEWWWVPIP